MLDGKICIWEGLWGYVHDHNGTSIHKTSAKPKFGRAEGEASYLPVSRPKPEGLRQGNEVAAEFRVSLIIF